MNITKQKKPMPTVSIFIEGNPTQQVTIMIYLGYMATEDGMYSNYKSCI